MRDLMRLRVTFSKNGPLTYTSHLDLARIWERGLRRAGAPLAYSQGFNPRPKLQLAAALPLGHTGGAELLDVWLEKPVPVEAFAKALVPVLPDGLAVGEVRQVLVKEPALPTQVVSAEYLVTAEGGGVVNEIEAHIERVMVADELPHERRGKPYDLRPLIERLWVEREGAGEVVLGMQLAARAGATARPEAVLEVLGMRQAFAHYHRRRLLLRVGGVEEDLL
jgi:radical SAM-linked protein